jgi:NADH:ubiquinone oxidoreductase subunit 5 (subunit L)/multisubunit Na+/H+ antiporter MnhA subunit
MVAQLFGALGAGAIVWGSEQALVQPRLKLLIGYATVAQLGCLFLIFPLAAAPGFAAWSGGLVLLTAHACAKAAMFLTAGNILHAAGHDRIRARSRADRRPARPLRAAACGAGGNWCAGRRAGVDERSRAMNTGALLLGVRSGRTFRLEWKFLPGLSFAFGADGNSVLFVTPSTVLWFWTTLYAVSYLEHSPHRSRFVAFFSLCVTATTGIALSANLITFLTFYELFTVTSGPRSCLP